MEIETEFDSNKTENRTSEYFGPLPLNVMEYIVYIELKEWYMQKTAHEQGFSGKLERIIALELQIGDHSTFQSQNLCFTAGLLVSKFVLDKTVFLSLLTDQLFFEHVWDVFVP